MEIGNEKAWEWKIVIMLRKEERDRERADSIIWYCFRVWGEKGDRKWESVRKENNNHVQIWSEKGKR